MSHTSLTSMMGRRVLLLSPHADDVAYSIGGLVARLSRRSDLCLMTVFGYSGWALPQAGGGQSTATISLVREREDRAYCARRGIDYQHLECPDSFVMGYDTAMELSMGTAADLRTEDVVDLVGHAVTCWGPHLVLAPSGLGGHIDHQIVRRAADSLHHLDVLYYEDLPYSASLPLPELERQLTTQGLTRAMTVDIDSVLQCKCQDMWGYRSQTCASTVAEMLLHAGRVGIGTTRYAERLWRRLT